MRKLFIICALLFCLGTASAQQKFSVASPDGKLKLVLDIAPEKVAYSVKYGKQQLLEDSRLGFEFDSGEFGAGLKAGKVQRRKIDETYRYPSPGCWQERRTITWEGSGHCRARSSRYSM